MPTSKTAIFDMFHPAVLATYWAVVILFAMVVKQPVFVLLTFASLLSFMIVVCGKSSLHMLFFASPVVLVLAVLNPIFVCEGQTFLFSVFGRSIFLEPAIYGLFQALVLLNVIMAFYCASCVLQTGKLFALFGRRLPTLTVVFSMVVRFMNAFVRQGKQLAKTMQACTSVGKIKPTKLVSRTSTALLGQGLEDGRILADVMCSRAWACGMPRTTYVRFTFCLLDALALVVLLLLAALSAASVVLWCANFAYYPSISPVAPWYAYASYAALLLLPFLVLLRFCKK